MKINCCYNHHGKDEVLLDLWKFLNITMTQFIAIIKIYALVVLMPFFYTSGSLYGQESISPQILQKLSIDPSSIPAEQQEKINSRVTELKAEGLTDTEILDRLVQENLIPESVRAEILSSMPAESETTPSETLTPQTDTDPAQSNNTVEPASPTQANTPTVQAAPPPAPKKTSPSITPKENSGIFGHHVFQDTSGAYVQAVSAIPPDDYRIGPGDEFNVAIWRCSELSDKLVVADDGSVFRPLIGKVYVGGQTYANAKNILLRKYKNFTSSCSQYEIVLSPVKRSININIVGEVTRPGGYSINATTPAFNALFEAGGISEIGSVRNIQIKRNGDVVQVLDIYEYLIQGNDKPIFLQNNDFIFVPVQDKIVSIDGAVKRPMKYELREDENLKALLLFSGGLAFNARRQNAQLNRLDSDDEVLIDFELGPYLTESGKDYPLFEGDRINIKELRPKLENTVTIQGSVKYPDIYQLLPGERVTDLISNAGGLEEDSYLEQAMIVRTLPETKETLYIPINLEQIVNKEDHINNLELQYNDVLQIFSRTEFLEERSISIQGHVRMPGTFKSNPGMSLKTLLYLARGPKKDADLNSVELSVITNPGDVNQDSLGATSIVATDDSTQTSAQGGGATDSNGRRLVRRIAIQEDWESDPTLDTIMVYPYTNVKIYSKYDFIFSREIQIGGAVNRSLTVPLRRGMSLKDLLYFAGGPREDADINEVELYQYIDLSEKGKFGVSSPRKEILRIEIDKDWRTSNQLDSIEVSNYYKVIIRSERDFVQKGFITIKGLVNNPGTYEVLPNMTLRDLLYQAGGLQMQADYDRIELARVMQVEQANGEIVPIPIEIRTIRTKQDWQKDKSLDDIVINSFDQVFVRIDPDFQLQESVFIDGEITTPGEYSKISKGERLSSLVGRANGPTELAYLEGATLIRQGIDNPISLKLHRALRNPNGRHDIQLLEGDRLNIPALTNVVIINGNVLQPGTTVMFEPGNSSLKYYIQQAGGFEKKTQRRNITVTYVDGRMKRTKRFFWKKFYPKIKQGSLIDVARKPEKEKKEEKEKKPVEINIQEILATLISVTTLYLLILRTSNN